MIGYPRSDRPRYMLLGLAFVLVAVLFVGFTVAIYRKAFTSTVDVTLQTDRVGTQLREGADVKVRGVRVGEVRAIAPSATGATLDLALDPDAVAEVPANVSAQLLPKTLFGERFVDLTIPDTPTRAIAAGDVIGQERTRSAIEVDQVLDNLLPTLQAVQPAQLATTLNAMSQALRGQGQPLGHTLVALDAYLKRFNPAVPDLVTDLDRLTPVADTYAEAAPHLFGGLDDLTTTSRTLVDERDRLEKLFLGVTDASNDLTDFLAHNQENLVDLAASSRPALQVLAKYAPEFPCLFRQVVEGIPRGDRTFGKGSAHPEQQRITIEISASRGKYVPGVDTPRFQDTRGPRCYKQVVPFPQYPPGGPLKDGTRHPPPPTDMPDPGLLGLIDPVPSTSGGSTRWTEGGTPPNGPIPLPLMGEPTPDPNPTPPGPR
ncbi:MCE family protein [Pseudonocardia acaciae]|uniref:MCE family protein n=1 Tax=Pseudonocardia acaciae TaxID=551276 RepID=UPI000684B50B|nr:MCE family protein [Pseudonocardia acaciae]